VNTAVENAVYEMLDAAGVDWQDDNFADTPKRFATWVKPLAVPVDQVTVKDILSAKFSEEHKEMVAVTNIRVHAACAHHLLPFTGVAHVGYLPGKYVVGISKLARLAQYIANRFTLQERVTTQIADALMTHLEADGAIVVVKAVHNCMAVRGVREPYAETVTSATRGLFRENANGCKTEFLSLIPSTIGGSL